MKEFLKKDKNNIYWLISFYVIGIIMTLMTIGLFELINSI